MNSYNRLRILVPPGAWLTEFRSVLTRRVCACGLRLEPERECHVQLTAAPGGSKRQRFVVLRRAQPKLTCHVSGTGTAARLNSLVVFLARSLK